MSPKRIIIDTDPGVDDALTFLLALASPEIQLEALTTAATTLTANLQSGELVGSLKYVTVSFQLHNFILECR